ncbi:MAG: cell division protein ZapA [Bacteroidota bacterium]
MKDQLSIKVMLAGRSYPLTIEKHEEESIRKAVKHINEKVSEYEKKYNLKDREYLLGMISLFFASQYLELQHTSECNNSSMTDKLEKIDKLISSVI